MPTKGKSNGAEIESCVYTCAPSVDRWLYYYPVPITSFGYRAGRLIVSSFAFNTIETVCFGGLRIFWTTHIILFSD